MITEALEIEAIEAVDDHLQDWCSFAREVLGANLDPEQEEILRAVQYNKKVSVKSGTSRGKDFVSAVAAVCFLYLTPAWNEEGEMVEYTKVAMTAPTGRQVENIMFPEVSRLFKRAQSRGFNLPGRLTGCDIRTENDEWFLTGFKADDQNTEAWTGFHAPNVMFVVTEASGMSDNVFNAIEGNLQGNSRLLIVFNDNTGAGYAAQSQKKDGWSKHRLDSLNAPNVVQRRIVIPGQVDWEWVNDRVRDWCTIISPSDFMEEEGDFWWENDKGRLCYRPNDLFRVKIRGMAPKVSSGVLVPPEWVEMAQKRWLHFKEQGFRIDKPLRLGVDVAGMGRDSSSFCHRHGAFLSHYDMIHSGGTANHMEVAGKVNNILSSHDNSQAFIDTIGEGAGVFSRLEELGIDGVHSVKFSEKAAWNDEDLTDYTGQYKFLNMRAYLFWSVRDWLNPAHNTGAMLPPGNELLQGLPEIQWKFRSDGKIQIEDKEEIKKRLGRSTDYEDALANTFYPVPDLEKKSNQKIKQSILSIFK